MYVITGGTGFLGLVLIKEMLNRKIGPIKVLVRDINRKELFKDLDVTIKVGSLNDEKFLTNEINEGDIVIHLAALVEIGNVSKELMYETNVLATKLIADISSSKNVKKFIYVSSTSAITTNLEIISEPSTFNHKKAIGNYAKTKSIASDYVLSLLSSNKLKGNIIYPSLIIGPEDYRISSISRVFINYLNKRFQSYIKGSYNFIDVRDLSEIIIKTIIMANDGETFLATNQTITIKEMFKRLDKYKKKKSVLMKIPLIIVKIFMPFIMFYYKIFKKDPIFTNESIRIINSNSNFDNSKVINDLNIHLRSLDDSFKDMVNFLREKELK